MANSIIQQKSFQFALDIIELYKVLIADHEYILSKQLLKSGTSIGANVEEATAGQSRQDFIAKLSIASKEARETRYWLRLLQASQLVKYDYSPWLAGADEQIRLLTAIVKTSSTNTPRR
jgi:four helix bundle protein